EPYCTKTFYVRDAQGNVMATYTTDSRDNGLVVNLEEYQIYGSDRLGTIRYNEAFYNMSDDWAPKGARTYELKNHLGNVLATVSDRKDYNGTNFSAHITSSQDYYPFGMQMPGRTYSLKGYRFGFQGQEKDDELKGAGNSYDFGARIYDTRLGRWLACDPLMFKYPNYSPYNYTICNPINYMDQDGRLIVDRNGKPVYTKGKIVPRPIGNGLTERYQEVFFYTNDGQKIYGEISLGIFKGVKVTKTYIDENNVIKHKEVTDWGGPIMELPEKNTYDCHAYVLIVSRDNTITEKVWIYSKHEDIFDIESVYKNENEYSLMTTNISDAKKGYVAVFADENGAITHSSVYNGDDSFNTKDENDELKTDATYKQQQDRWGSCIGFYKKNEDRKTDLKSKDGAVSDRKMKKVLKDDK
ncbi:MAG: RHS repeat-associated core domain-containing protein, partial [Bacteroidales bacterium]|nr:RHS repeat-associated core domain-containing protein [Bacteroidales bacterium]